LPGFLQSNDRLIRRHPQQDNFGVDGKVGPFRTGGQYADFILKSEPEGRDPGLHIEQGTDMWRGSRTLHKAGSASTLR
jgi:hypothetical protein